LRLQLRVLCLGFFRDEDVWVGVFPEREEVLPGREGADPRSGGIGALRSSRREGVRDNEHFHIQERGGPVSDARAPDEAGAG